MDNSFDFSVAPKRRNTASLKWDLAKDDEVIPLWVADMDFTTAPSILQALEKRVKHGVFGYELLPDPWYRSIINWQKDRNGLEVKKEDIIPVPAIIPAVSAALQALCQGGEQVIMQTPAYNCFYSCIRNSGLELAKNTLIRGEERYEINFEDLEEKLSHERARVLLLCNPHNPTGRIWTAQELQRIGALCIKYDITVLSDEIHSDLRPKGSVFTSFATLSPQLAERTVTFNSASKAFNLAGLQCAYIIVKDPHIRRRIDRRININEVCDLNIMGATAMQSAYESGSSWLLNLNGYLRENIDLVCDFLKKELPKAVCLKPEATYLMWIDFSAYGKSSKELYKDFLRAKVMLSLGTEYGSEGEGFMRLNVACPRALLKQGLLRIKQALL